jgi:hypothetical protein
VSAAAGKEFEAELEASAVGAHSEVLGPAVTNSILSYIGHFATPNGPELDALFEPLFGQAGSLT